MKRVVYKSEYLNITTLQNICSLDASSSRRNDWQSIVRNLDGIESWMIEYRSMEAAQEKSCIYT
ncbi:hypothetical protein TE101_08185 [Alteromonas macleodii]|nr:hypothetical protein TE101_08185 [Alteromonas macleodii]